MIIALGSDWHLGITKEKAIRLLLIRMQKDNPDVIILPGDFCGGMLGYKSVRSILRLVRQYFPHTPVLVTMGNHDYWTHPSRIKWSELGMSPSSRRLTYPPLEAFSWNLRKITDICKELNIHFLDQDGIYRHPAFPGVAIAGHTMWYANPPPSNDQNFLPLGMGGSTHRFLYKESIAKAQDIVEGFLPSDTKRVFVSHFPLTELREADKVWSGDPWFGVMLEEVYDVKAVLNGHAHQLHKGPKRFEAGSDYEKPQYILINTETL